MSVMLIFFLFKFLSNITSEIDDLYGSGTEKSLRFLSKNLSLSSLGDFITRQILLHFSPGVSWLSF